MYVCVCVCVRARACVHAYGQKAHEKTLNITNQ